MTFEELMSRAAEPALEQIVGRPGVRLLSRLDPELAQPSKLREVAEGLLSPQDMLLDKQIRKELLMLLPRHESEALLRHLSLEVGRDPYIQLAELRVSPNTARSRKLLDFFSLEEVTPEVAEAQETLEEISPAHALFPHQRIAADRVFNLIKAEPHRVLLHMPTGAGKTRTAMHVICRLMNEVEPFQVVWLAHSEELCEQAVEEFKRAWAFLGNRPVKVHRWWGDHELSARAARDGLVVAGLAKAFSAAQRSTSIVGSLAGSVGLVVMDEAHQAVAPSYQHVLDLLTQAGEPTALLGLTATPGRTWDDIDEDQKLIDFFYSKKVSLEVSGFDNPVDYLIDEGYLAKTNFNPLYSNSGIELSNRDRIAIERELEIPRAVIAQLADDEQRNLLVINRVEEMVTHHSRILVFAATVEHARLIASVLEARGVDANAVTGETPSLLRASIIDHYRERSDGTRVLVNYGVLTTGFDAPQTSAALIARPTKSLVLYSQMVGRATRGWRAGGNKESEVATVVDTALPGFGSMSEAFVNWEREWQTN